MRDGRAGRRENLCDFLNYVLASHTNNFILTTTELPILIDIIETMYKIKNSLCVIFVIVGVL